MREYIIGIGNLPHTIQIADADLKHYPNARPVKPQTPPTKTPAKK